MGLLRTLLALAVVFAHSTWNNGYVLVGGPNAVRLFYMISGFLIAHVLRSNHNYQDPWRFYANRALKIYPIYYFVAAMSGLWLLIRPAEFVGVYDAAPLSAVVMLVASNLLIFGQDWVMFAGIEGGGGNSTAALTFLPDFTRSQVLLYKGLLVPQAWTLGVELSFYVLAPFILRRRSTLLILLVASSGIRVLLFALGWGTKDPWTYRFFPAELALFLTGALANHWLLPAWERVIQVRQWAWLPVTATAALLLICIIYFRIQAPEGWKIAVLLPAFALLMPLAFLFQNQSALDQHVGELSYPIYIGHMLVIWIGSEAIQDWTSKWPPLGQSLLWATLSIAFAYLLKIGIADRIEIVRSRIRQSRVEK
jgi:peptidoglycan/LPS O-acetylase OafA/YrhL